MRTLGTQWAIAGMAIDLATFGIGVARPADAATATPGVTRSTISCRDRQRSGGASTTMAVARAKWGLARAANPWEWWASLPSFPGL